MKLIDDLISDVRDKDTGVRGRYRVIMCEI
jgi:hypothetical protein